MQVTGLQVLSWGWGRGAWWVAGSGHEAPLALVPGLSMLKAGSLPVCEFATNYHPSTVLGTQLLWASGASSSGLLSME